MVVALSLVVVVVVVVVVCLIVSITIIRLVALRGRLPGRLHAEDLQWQQW